LFLSAVILNLLLRLLFRIEVEVVCHLHNNWPHECGHTESHCKKGMRNAREEEEG